MESERPSDRRAQRRDVVSLPCRLVVDGLAATIDGHSLDVSPNGIGVRFDREAAKNLDAILERLVEDRSMVEVTLRLDEGAVTTRGQLMWWGLLGSDENAGIRAGILLPSGWREGDWELLRAIVG